MEMGEIICFYGFSGNYFFFLFSSQTFSKRDSSLEHFFFPRIFIFPISLRFPVLFASPPSPSLDKRRFRLPRLTWMHLSGYSSPSLLPSPFVGFWTGTLFFRLSLFSVSPPLPLSFRPPSRSISSSFFTAVPTKKRSQVPSLGKSKT